MAERRQRLDLVLAGRGLSRARAADAIRRGAVRVDGVPALKPSQMVAPDADIRVGPTARFVSRAANKLDHALDHFALSPAGCACLDTGASTGGFTEVLLERGAAHVHAVDVGHGQLAPHLAADCRVNSLQGTDARALTAEMVGGPIGFITADVSFIGLEKVLPAALALAGPGAALVALVKPQFEAGPGAVGRDGVLRDAAAREAAVTRIVAWLAARGWPSLGVVPSPLPGKAGNLEWLVAARRAGGTGQ